MGGLKGYGQNVTVEHANGYLSLYGHTGQALVSAGEAIQHPANLLAPPADGDFSVAYA